MTRFSRFFLISIFLLQTNLALAGLSYTGPRAQAPLRPAPATSQEPLSGRVEPVAFFDPPERSDQEPPRVHFTPSLDIFEVYDDNILLRSVRRDDDYITRVRPGIELAVEQERVKWLTDLKVEFENYQNHSELSTLDRSQTLDTNLTIRPDLRWTFVFTDAFLHSRDPAEAPELGVLFGVRDYIINRASLLGSYRWTPRLTTEIEGINRTTQFKDKNLISVNMNEIRAAFTYVLTPLDKITPEYTYRDFYFRNRANTEAHTLSVKGERRFSQTLTVRGLIGGLVLVDRGTQRSDVLLGLGADQTASPTVVFHFDYSRDIAVVGGLSGIFVTNVVIGSVTAHVTERFDSTAALTASIQEARLARVASHPDVNTWGGRVEERYTFLSWLKGFASYAYTEQRQTGGRKVYDNRAMVGLTFSQTYPERP